MSSIGPHALWCRVVVFICSDHNIVCRKMELYIYTVVIRIIWWQTKIYELGGGGNKRIIYFSRRWINAKNIIFANDAMMLFVLSCHRMFASACNLMKYRLEIETCRWMCRSIRRYNIWMRVYLYFFASRYDNLIKPNYLTHTTLCHYLLLWDSEVLKWFSSSL